MLESIIRPKIQKLCFDSVAHCLHRYSSIHANHITAASCLLGCLIPIALILHQPLLAVGLLFLSGYLDALDGTLARLKEEAGSIGVIYDIVSDRLVELMVILGLYFIDPERALMSLMMLGSVLLCVTSFLVVGIVTENHSEKGFHYSPGLMERPEAFLCWTLMILFPHFFYPLAWTFSLLVLYTTGVRILECRAHEKRL